MATAEEGIVQVLERSQRQRLQAMPEAADSAPALALRSSFERLRSAGLVPPGTELRVVSGGTWAEAMLGRLLVVHESLGARAEGERLFLLAHELGHLAGDHWTQMAQIYLKWVPGAVTREHTDPVAGMLGREASGMAHHHELEADAFALQALRRVGVPDEAGLAALLAQGMQLDTATHPGTRKRLAALRLSPPAAADSAAVSAQLKLSSAP